MKNMEATIKITDSATYTFVDVSNEKTIDEDTLEFIKKHRKTFENLAKK